MNAAPLIPGLTDEELPAILRAAACAGATSAGYMLVRLPGAVQEVFEEWLRRTLPDRADRVLHRVREGKGGRLNDPRFGHRFRSTGPYADAVRQVFRAEVRRLGLNRGRQPLATHHFRRLPGGQMDRLKRASVVWPSSAGAARRPLAGASARAAVLVGLSAGPANASSASASYAVEFHDPTDLSQVFYDTDVRPSASTVGTTERPTTRTVSSASTWSPSGAPSDAEIVSGGRAGLS